MARSSSWFLWALLLGSSCSLDARETRSVQPGDGPAPPIPPSANPPSGQGGSVSDGASGSSADPEPCLGCSIDGTCFEAAVARPDDPCQVCDPERAASAWSDVDGPECQTCNGAAADEVNVNSDPDHCGRCGHSCLGAACEGGICALSVLADYGERQALVRVVGDSVYSSDAGSINRNVHRARRDGSVVEPQVAIALGGLKNFDEDDAYFYLWRAPDRDTLLIRCPSRSPVIDCADDSATTQLPLSLDRTAEGSSVVVDRIGHRVFYYNFLDGALFASPTAGGLIQTRLVGTFAFEFIYTANALWGSDAGNPNAILRVSSTGEEPNTVANEAAAFGFAANGARLYWISGDHVSSIALPGGNGTLPPDRFSGPVSPLALAVDDGDVYWVETTPLGEAVKRCPATGCPATGATTITPPISEALALALDDRKVYIALGTPMAVGSVQVEGGVLWIAK